MEPGHIGEGIVIKNYSYRDKFGHYVQGKLVRDEFKEQNIKFFGPTILKGPNQDTIEFVEEYLTKERLHKILLRFQGFSVEKAHLIPRLFETVYKELISEELYEFVKGKRNRDINFKTLYAYGIKKIKELKPELFGAIVNS